MTHLPQEVISADEVPVPDLHTERRVSCGVLQLILKALVPPGIARLLHHLQKDFTTYVSATSGIGACVSL